MYYHIYIGNKKLKFAIKKTKGKKDDEDAKGGEDKKSAEDEKSDKPEEEEEQNNPDTFIDSELDFEAAVAKREKTQLN